MKRFWRRTAEATARADRDDWLEWLRLSDFSPLTMKSYRLTTDKLLERWPELTFAELTDEHILGIIEEAKPASRQARRSAFQNWLGIIPFTQVARPGSGLDSRRCVLGSAPMEGRSLWSF